MVAELPDQRLFGWRAVVSGYITRSDICSSHRRHGHIIFGRDGDWLQIFPPHSDQVVAKKVTAAF